MSNFLGGIGPSSRSSKILSTALLTAREGMALTKGMTYRDGGPLLSVFLVLPHEGSYDDQWDRESETYTFRGHDSTTVEEGKSIDQLAMYQSGRMTGNGRFYKAAREWCEGRRKEPLQVQVYEKLSPGAWFDKGIFDLMDAHRDTSEGRAVYRFSLRPADLAFLSDKDDPARAERFLTASAKASAWDAARGRCCTCGAEEDLFFTPERDTGNVLLFCGAHAGIAPRGML